MSGPAPSPVRLGLAVAATALMLALILWPRDWLPADEARPRLIPHSDKLVHFGLFAGCAGLWTAALGRRGAPAILAAGLILAVGTEWLQGLPAIARDPDPLDAVADALGAGAAVVGVLAWLRPGTEPEAVA